MFGATLQNINNGIDTIRNKVIHRHKNAPEFVARGFLITPARTLPMKSPILKVKKHPMGMKYLSLQIFPVEVLLTNTTIAGNTDRVTTKLIKIDKVHIQIFRPI